MLGYAEARKNVKKDVVIGKVLQTLLTQKELFEFDVATLSYERRYMLIEYFNNTKKLSSADMVEYTRKTIEHCEKCAADAALARHP